MNDLLPVSKRAAMTPFFPRIPDNVDQASTLFDFLQQIAGTESGAKRCRDLAAAGLLQPRPEFTEMTLRSLAGRITENAVAINRTVLGADKVGAPTAVRLPPSVQGRLAPMRFALLSMGTQDSDTAEYYGCSEVRGGRRSIYCGPLPEVAILFERSGAFHHAISFGSTASVLREMDRRERGLGPASPSVARHVTIAVRPSVDRLNACLDQWSERWALEPEFEGLSFNGTIRTPVKRWEGDSTLMLASAFADKSDIGRLSDLISIFGKTISDEHIELGLTHGAALIRVSAIEHAVRLTDSQFERAASDRDPVVREAVALRKDWRPTLSQLDRGLVDEVDYVREAFESRGDVAQQEMRATESAGLQP